MKLAVIIAVIFFLGATSLAQEPCNISLNDAPAVFGLKLGMPVEQVQTVLGKNLKIKPKKTGEGSFFQNFVDQPAPSNLSGVRALFLRFVNNKVYQIEIFYEDKSEWKSVEEFASSLSVNLNLPAAAWKTKNGRAEMGCGDFTVTADKILNPHIELTDDAAFAEFIKTRQQKHPKKKGRS